MEIFVCGQAERESRGNWTLLQRDPALLSSYQYQPGVWLRASTLSQMHRSASSTLTTHLNKKELRERSIWKLVKREQFVACMICDALRIYNICDGVPIYDEPRTKFLRPNKKAFSYTSSSPSSSSL